MIRLRQAFHDYAAAGAPNTVFAPYAFVDDSTFLTTGGDVGLVYQIRGCDYEGLDHGARAAIAKRVAIASRLLDDRFEFLQYLFKRRVGPFVAPPCAHPVAAAAIQRRAAMLTARQTTQHEALYELDLYAVILVRGLAPVTSTALSRVWTQPRQALREWLSDTGVFTILEQDLVKAIGTLHYAASSWESQLADTIRPTRLDQAGSYRFFRRLVNHAPHKIAIPLKHQTDLGAQMSDSEVRLYDSHLTVDGWTVKLLTMKDPTAHTFANILEDLHRISGEFTACLDWHQTPVGPTRRQFWKRKVRYAGQSKQAPVGSDRSTGQHPALLLHDESAEASAAQIGEALKDMEVGGDRFGDCALTLAIMDPDPAVVDQAVADAIEALAQNDGQFLEETYNSAHAWLAMVPGNHAYQMRSLPLTDRNLADLSLVCFTLDRGLPVSPHLHQPALAVFETRSSTPYWWNLHVDDVGHVAIIGPTGKGKSYLANFSITHALQYDPFIVILDMGHSYRQLAEAHGGSYLDVHLDRQTVPMNPFAATPTPTNWEFQRQFLRVLLEGGGQPKLLDAEDRALYQAVKNLSVHEPAMRRLSTLKWLVPNHLTRRLEKWIVGGRYGHLFDHDHDAFTFNALQVLEFSALQDLPDVLDPLLFYVLHRVRDQVRDSTTLSLCVMDETWRAIQHPTVYAYLQDAVKTWRKENAAMIVISQSMEDFGDLQRTIIENCPTKILLANDRLDRAQYATAFGLNELELDTVAGLRPREEIFMKRPDVSKVWILRTDPESHRIYAPQPRGLDRPQDADDVLVASA